MSGAATDLGFTKALQQMRAAITPHGFVASNTDLHNYKRIWGRDGVIVSIAALQTDEADLHLAARNTLQTLHDHQGPHGEIPSNVDMEKGQVSYGGTAGRVDANLWFVIGCHRYWQKTQDEEFLQKFLPSIRKVEFLLGAWEFNTKGLLYVPETGDWADEYISHGYVLYDQLLYYRALQDMARMYEAAGEDGAHALQERASVLRDLIQANYWFYDCDPDTAHAYHPNMFKRGCDLAGEKDSYWMSFFSPTGYGYRFDAMANVLASFFGIASDEQRNHVDQYIDEKCINPDLKILPAFSPVIEPLDTDWQRLQSTFSNTFKNRPYEYHNGGLWPLINGFYVADLAARGNMDRARDFLSAIDIANEMDTESEGWGFYEFIHGQTLKPGGARHQAWSASAAVMGHLAMIGTPPLPIE